MKTWSNMQERVEAYLCARRRLGYILRIEGQQLLRFARYADQKGHVSHITIDLAVEWATASPKSHRIGCARRLEVVRALAKYCALFEPETEIPPGNLLGVAHRRKSPHIYSDGEITLLLDTAKELLPKHGLRPKTIHCLLGLLVSTGLRISEALRLNRYEVDLDQHVLLIKMTKFRKSRYVPMHPVVSDVLSQYADFRDNRLPVINNSAFFLLDDGSALQYRQAHYAFHVIRSKLGWKICRNGRYPRLYDLRHTFVCRRILSWYEQGADVNWAMPVLSTYLGHAKVSDTYWYLTGIPELMIIVAALFENQYQVNLMRGES